jgi:hypothetical protein
VRYAVAGKAVNLFEDVKGLGWTTEGADELSQEFANGSRQPLPELVAFRALQSRQVRALAGDDDSDRRTAATVLIDMDGETDDPTRRRRRKLGRHRDYVAGLFCFPVFAISHLPVRTAAVTRRSENK